MNNKFTGIPVWAWLMTALVLFVNGVYFLKAFEHPVDGLGIYAGNSKCVVSRVW